MLENISHHKSSTARKADLHVNGNRHQRSERFFKLADDWYFITRENVTLGPFRSYTQAKDAVATFVDFIAIAPARIIEVFVGDTA